MGFVIMWYFNFTVINFRKDSWDNFKPAKDSHIFTLSSYRHYIITIIRNYNSSIITYSFNIVVITRDNIIRIIKDHNAKLALYSKECYIYSFNFNSFNFIIIRFDIIEIIAIINLTLNLVEILITITNEEIIFQQLPITVNLW